MKPEEAAKVILRKLSKSPVLKEKKRRDLFISHLHALYPDYAWQISEYAVGAEEPVKIKSKSGEKTVTGRIDTRKGALLIEYKTDLTKVNQINEAEDQLKDYVAGIVKQEGSDSVNKCIASDILRWQEYNVKTPDKSTQEEIKSEDIELEPLRDYEFSTEDISDFLDITKHLIFEDVPQVATGELLADLFGIGSDRYEEFTSKLLLL